MLRPCKGNHLLNWSHVCGHRGDLSDLIFWWHDLPDDLFSFLRASHRGRARASGGSFSLNWHPSHCADFTKRYQAALCSDPTVLVISCTMSLRHQVPSPSGHDGGGATEKCPRPARLAEFYFETVGLLHSTSTSCLPPLQGAGLDRTYHDDADPMQTSGFTVTQLGPLREQARRWGRGA